MFLSIRLTTRRTIKMYNPFRGTLIFISIAFCVGEDSNTVIVQYKYYLGYVCDLNFRTLLNCSVKVAHEGRDNSILNCVSQCGSDSKCIGASLSWTGECYKHFECPEQTSCSRREKGHHYRSKKCANNGQFNPEDSSCRCVDMYVGATCEDKPTKCEDLLSSGYPEGTYSLSLDPDLDGRNIILFNCDVLPDSGEVRIPVFKHEGRADLSRGWLEYVEGFTVDASNYWIGLRHWHALATLGHTTLWAVLDFGEMGSLMRKWTNFKLKEETSRYSYFYESSQVKTVGGMGNADNLFEDCFSHFEYTPFSTADSFEDSGLGYNCPRQTGYGWWFVDCSPTCNLFGAFGQWAEELPTVKHLSVPQVNETLVMRYLERVYMYLE